MTKEEALIFQPVTFVLCALSLCIAPTGSRADDLTTGNRFGYQQEQVPTFAERVKQLFSTRNASDTASTASASVTQSISNGMAAAQRSAADQALDAADTAEELYTDYVDPKNYLSDIERSEKEYRSWFTKSILQASDDVSKWSDQTAKDLSKELK